MSSAFSYSRRVAFRQRRQGRAPLTSTRRLLPSPGSFLAWLIAVGFVASCACADDAYLQFVEGLRQRRFFDTALEYLDDIAMRGDLPADVQETLDLQRGITYRQMAAASRIPEDREQLLGQAETFLKRFASEQANHEQAAFANSELGELLFERAQTLIWQADSPPSADRIPQLQQQARAIIGQARDIYQRAHDQYKQQYDAYPQFIDESKDEELYARRLLARGRYLRAWLNLVRCTYEKGKTYDKGSDERRQVLVEAAELYDEIHQTDRKNPAGLQAWLMMGRCFQEQDDIGRALGIYNDVKDQPSQNTAVMRLKETALHYRLMCLNHEDRKNHQLVLQEADAWLNQNRKRALSETGLGILWEKTIAEANLANDRTLDEKQREILHRQAMADAQQVGRFNGPYREPALAMARRITAELGDSDKEPRDFETAFERAKGMVSQIQDLKQDIVEASTSANEQATSRALSMHLNEVGRLLQLALDLRDGNTDPKAVAQARYLLSFVYLRQRKSFDAVILARYCMQKDRQADPDTALNATEIAITACVQAWNDADPDDREFEVRLIKDVCEEIVAEYPQSRRGNEARIRLGKVYRQLDAPLKAAEAFLAVPETDAEYASARMEAGQAYWAAWTTTTAATESGDRVEQDAAVLQQWKSEARTLLEQGIRLAREKLGESAAPSDDVIAAEVSLASILNLDGQYAQTIQRLTSGGDESVVASVAVTGDQPDKGVRSQAFVGLMYRLLLRAYVGTQQINLALQVMHQLEQTGGQNTAAIYTQLGQELQDELRQLKSSGQSDRLNEVRQSFEQFLQQVYQQRNRSDYNSLLWIGETYFGLGQGVSDNAADAATYYQRAADAYQEILASGLASGTTQTAIRLRLVRCRRQQGEFEDAIRIAREILQQNELALDVQFEAAYTLADWGAAPGGQPEKLLTSIEGIKDDKIWGWSLITRRLQRQSGTPEWEQLEERFLEARYELTNSRLRYATTNAANAKQQLESALAEITIFAQVFGDLNDAWWNRFERLYQDIQAELGQTSTPLERPEAPAVAQPAADPSDNTANGSAAILKSRPTPQNAAAASTDSPNPLLIALALALAAGGAGAVYKLMSKPPRRRRPVYAAGSDKFVPPPVPAPAPRRKPSAAGTATATKPRRKVERPAAPANSGAQQKRQLTPEEMARRKAAAARKKQADGGKPPAERPAKKIRKRPPQPPPE